jgi:hypothetical protein
MKTKIAAVATSFVFHTKMNKSILFIKNKQKEKKREKD